MSEFNLYKSRDELLLDKDYVVTMHVPNLDLLTRIPRSIRGFFKITRCAVKYRNGDVYPVNNLDKYLLV